MENYEFLHFTKNLFNLKVHQSSMNLLVIDKQFNLNNFALNLESN